MLWLPERDGGRGAIGLVDVGRARRRGRGPARRSLEGAAALVRSRLDESAEVLTVPFGAAAGRRCARARPARRRRSSPTTHASPRSRPSSAGSRPGSARACRPPATARERSTSPATRSPPSPPTTVRLPASPGSPPSPPAGTRRSSGGSATTRLDVVGSYGPIEADEALQRAAGAVVEQSRACAPSTGTTSARVVTLQLGQPVLGALQVRFAPGGHPTSTAASSSPASPSAPRTRCARPSGARGRARARAQPRSARRRRRGDLAALALAHARDGDRARRAPPRRRPGRRLPHRRGRARRRGVAAASRARTSRSRTRSSRPRCSRGRAA